MVGDSLWLCRVHSLLCLSLPGFSLTEMLVFWVWGGAELLWQVRHHGCSSEHFWSHKHWGREAALPAPLGSCSRRGEVPVNLHSWGVLGWADGQGRR